MDKKKCPNPDFPKKNWKTRFSMRLTLGTFRNFFLDLTFMEVIFHSCIIMFILCRYKYKLNELKENICKNTYHLYDI